VLNDLTNSQFSVYSDIGKAYDTVKQQNKEEIIQIIGLLDPMDPMRKAYILQYNTLMDGVAFKDARNYANDQLVMMGFKEPETPEQEQMLMQAQQQAEQQAQQPDSSMVMAQAEMLKGQADLLEQQNRQAEMSISAGKIQAEAVSRSEKLQSETQLNIAKIQQNQQTIDNDKQDKQTKNAISIAEMELENGRELSRMVSDNYGGLRQSVNP
jgi:hypothetical protein